MPVGFKQQQQNRILRASIFLGWAFSTTMKKFNVAKEQTEKENLLKDYHGKMHRRVFLVALQKYELPLEIAEEVTNQAFIKLFELSLDKIKSLENVEGYIMQSAKNGCIDAHRKIKRQQEKTIALDAVEYQQGNNPYGKINLDIDVENILAQLSTEDAQLLRWIAEGYIYREIAERLDISEAAVKKRAKRAKAKAKQLYQPYD